LDNLWRRIAVLTVCRRTVNLDQLRKINPRAEAVMNRFRVCGETIRRDLKSAFRGSVDFLREIHCVAYGSASKMPSEHKLGMPLNTDKAIGIAKGLGMVFQSVLFLAADESPHFVAFNVGHANFADPILKHALTPFSDQRQQPHDRVAVHPRDSFDAPNGVSFYQQTQNRFGLLHARVHPVDVAVMGLGERLAALWTAEALIPFAVLTEAIGRQAAVWACHFDPCLFRASEPR
jgi:hypothetical protein